MDLILWRHAEAEDGFDDDMQRRLTAKGVKQADKMAAFLRPLLPKQTHILVSPAVRTQQTARALGLDFITEPVIAPGAPAEALLAAAKRTHADCVLLVGHQPCLGEAAALLMGAAHGWSVKKGAVWWLSLREQYGTAGTVLKLVVTPEMLPSP